MSRKMIIMIVAGGLLLAVSTQAIMAQATAPSPTTIPSGEIRNLTSLFEPRKKPTSEEELREMAVSQMREVLENSKKLEEKYPNAKNIWQIREMSFQATAVSNRFKPDEDMLARQIKIAKQLIDDPRTPDRVKVKMEAVLLRHEQKEGTLGKGEEIDKKLEAFLARYPKDPVKLLAITEAVVLAHENQRTDLVDKWADTLEKKYSGKRGVTKILIKIGRGPEFKASLQKTDGTILTLPNDLKGKIVVIDFWATWCPPCIVAMPKLKKLYEKYNHKDVEFVGISLDEDKKALLKFIKSNKLKWIQTYSGNGSEDPTALRYEVNSIPRMMVLSKEGKIISDDAHGQLEQLIEQQLALEEKK